MQIRQLEFFLEVANCKSISKAAEKAFISQQSLSASISALEKELGFPIFERSSKGVIMTPEGAQIFDDAKLIINLIGNWSKISARRALAPMEEFYFISPPFFNQRIPILAELMLSLPQKSPDTNFQFREARGARTLSSIPEGKPFVAISCYTPGCTKADTIAFAVKNDYVLEELCAVPQYLIINANHPYANQESIDIAQLCYLTLVTLHEHSYFPHLNSYFNSKASTYYVDNSEQALHLITLDEHMATFDSEKTLDYLSTHYSGRLKAVPLSGQKLFVKYFILHRAAKECTTLELGTINSVKNRVQAVFPEV